MPIANGISRLSTDICTKRVNTSNIYNVKG